MRLCTRWLPQPSRGRCLTFEGHFRCRVFPDGRLADSQCPALSVPWRGRSDSAFEPHQISQWKLGFETPVFFWGGNLIVEGLSLLLPNADVGEPCWFPRAMTVNPSRANGTTRTKKEQLRCYQSENGHGRGHPNQAGQDPILLGESAGGLDLSQAGREGSAFPVGFIACRQSHMKRTMLRNFERPLTCPCG